MGFFTKIMKKVTHNNIKTVANAISDNSTGAKEWRELKKKYEKKSITWTEFQKQVKEHKKQFEYSLINKSIDVYVSSERLKKSQKRAKRAQKVSDRGLTF